MEKERIIKQIMEVCKQADMEKVLNKYNQPNRLVKSDVKILAKGDRIGEITKDVDFITTEPLEIALILPVVYLYDEKEDAYTPYIVKEMHDCGNAYHKAGYKHDRGITLIKWAHNLKFTRNEDGSLTDITYFPHKHREELDEAKCFGVYLRNEDFEKEHKILLENDNLPNGVDWKDQSKYKKYGARITYFTNVTWEFKDNEGKLHYVLVPGDRVVYSNKLGFIGFSTKEKPGSGKLYNPIAYAEDLNVWVDEYEGRKYKAEESLPLFDDSGYLGYPTEFYALEEGGDGKPSEIMTHYYSALVLYNDYFKEDVDSGIISDKELLQYLGSIYLTKDNKVKQGIFQEN